MRLYEFSKEVGVPNKDIIRILVEAGYEVASHMSLLTKDHLDVLNKKFKRQASIVGSEEKKIIKENHSTSQNKEKISTSMNTQKQISSPGINIVDEVSSQKKLKQEKIGAASSLHSKSHSKQPEVGGRVNIKSMTVGELAEKIGVSSSELILDLLKKGLFLNKNQLLQEAMVEEIVKKYGLEGVRNIEQEVSMLRVDEDELKNKKTRAPIVVVIGHVDHGKTTLLDYIRNSRVASREKGGITQHLGAYEVKTPKGKVVFLDTPGHEAFKMMRQRGIKSADIAILIVAADDGVMPQTIEAINQAQSANVPVMVAITKIDKFENTDSANVSSFENIKTQLSKYGLLTEDWGGQTICVPISAKTGKNIDQLLEMILLQAEIMELKSDETVRSCGYVLESKIEKGLGPVATFIAQHGILRVGDYFVCGKTQGKVSTLIDSDGNRLSQISPAIPVKISGFNELPQAGDYFQVVGQQEYNLNKENKAGLGDNQASVRQIPEDSIKVIVKADAASSREALLGSIEQLSSKSEKKIFVVQSGMGSITESDVVLAADTGSIIYGFNVKPEPKALALAQRLTVSLKLYYVIYHLLDDIELIIKNEKKVEYKLVKTGEAVVRKVFDIKGLGVIAGFYVKDGKMVRDGRVVIFRGNKKIGDGPIESLQRDKRSMKEVASGFEGALLVQDFKDWQVEDRIECFTEVPVG